MTTVASVEGIVAASSLALSGVLPFIIKRKWAHIVSLVAIVVGAGLAFLTIRREGAAVRARGETTGAFFIDLSAWLVLGAAAFANQWIAYKFYNPGTLYQVRTF